MSSLFAYETQLKMFPKDKSLRASIMEKLKRKAFTDVSLNSEGKLVGTSKLKGMKAK